MILAKTGILVYGLCVALSHPSREAEFWHCTGDKILVDLLESGYVVEHTHCYAQSTLDNRTTLKTTEPVGNLRVIDCKEIHDVRDR